MGILANLRTRISTAIAPRQRIQAKFDAAQTTSNNVQHWLDADSFSANAAMSASVRNTLRIRCRHEVINNSYAFGLVQTLANDTIGTGPRLQIQTENESANEAIEKEFGAWAKQIGLAHKLRLMRICRSQDGEAFGLLITNEKLTGPVKLDLKLIEADQVASAWTSTFFNPGAVDGMKFDDAGNVTEWHVLKNHPGDFYGIGAAAGYDVIRPADMIQYFRPIRPGQMRGIPELTPALSLFAQLRQYSQAVLDAARAAANVSGVVYSDLPQVVEEDGATSSANTVVTMQRNGWPTMPAGWKIAQIKAEQPTNTYKDFKNEILLEIARCLSIPANVAKGDSSGYNYASGRLDHQTYYKSLRVERECMIDAILNRVFKAWLAEASLIPGYLPIERGLSHTWFWAGQEHVDPAKEAKAQEIRLSNRTTTYAEEMANKGQDYVVVFNQIAREQALAKKLGIELPGMVKPEEEIEDDDE